MQSVQLRVGTQAAMPSRRSGVARQGRPVASSIAAPRFEGTGDLAKALFLAGVIQLVATPITLPLRLIDSMKNRKALEKEFKGLEKDSDKVALLKVCLDRNSTRFSSGGGTVKWAVGKLGEIQNESDKIDLILQGLKASDWTYLIGEKKVLKTLVAQAKTIQNPRYADFLVKAAENKQIAETTGTWTDKSSHKRNEADNNYRYYNETVATRLKNDAEFSQLKTEPEQFGYLLKQIQTKSAATIHWAVGELEQIKDDKRKSELVLSGLNATTHTYYPKERQADVFNALHTAAKSIQDAGWAATVGGLVERKLAQEAGKNADYAALKKIEKETHEALVGLETDRVYPAKTNDIERHGYLKAMLERYDDAAPFWASQHLADVQAEPLKSELVLMALDKFYPGKLTPEKDAAFMKGVLDAAHSLKNPDSAPQIIAVAEEKNKLAQPKQETANPLWRNSQDIRNLLNTFKKPEEPKQGQ